MLALVVREAFSIRAAAGGTLGILVAMRYGLARGMYANEAGYGTAAVAYGTAQSREPRAQGLNAVMEVFIVSFVTSTISALSILLTGAYLSGQTSTAAVALAFDAAMPGVGGWIVAVCVFLFGYTTLIGWAYYGEQFLEYIFGPAVVMPYRWIYCLLIPLGAITNVDLVWAWGDLMNALQMFPNIIGVLGLSGLVAAVANQPAPAMLAADATPEDRHRTCISFASPSQTAGRCCCTRAHADSRRRSTRRARTRSRSRRTRTCAGIRCAASGWRTPRHRQHRTFLPPPEYNPLAPSTDPATSDRSAGRTVGRRGLREPVPHADAARARSAGRDRRDPAGPRRVRGGGVHAGPDRLARDAAARRTSS